MDTKHYQIILDYKLSESEIQVYKIAILWEILTSKYFPNSKGISKLPKGDPRKCTLFKFCWKLYRSTRGLLKENEYKLYIQANLQIIKVHNGHISPNVLCGDKAWIRWKIWKRLYDQKLQESKGQVVVKKEIDPKIVKHLDKTKRFLFEKFNGEPSFSKLQEFFDNKSIKMWILSGKLSHYWLILSPWMKKICNIQFLEKDLNFCANVYKEKINEAIQEYFKEEFEFEFQ